MTSTNVFTIICGHVSSNTKEYYCLTNNVSEIQKGLRINCYILLRLTLQYLYLYRILTNMQCEKNK